MLFLKCPNIARQFVNQDLAIQNYEVPLPLCQSSQFSSSLRDYDNVLYKIFLASDGVKCVQKISEELQIEIDIVKQCLKCLFNYDLIRMVDIFKFSNHYTINSSIHQFMKNEELIQ